MTRRSAQGGRVDLLRHGEPVGGRRYRGHGVDDPLSEKGWRQMWRAVDAAPMPWARIVSSPMRRCRAFAQALAEREGLPLTIDEDLREVGFGDWEGRSPAEVREADPAAHAAFYADPVHNRPAGAEPLADFVRRSVYAFERVVDSAAGGRALVVAHAGVLRAIAAHSLAAPLVAIYRLRIDHAAFVSITATADGRRVVDGVNLSRIRA